MRSSLNNYLIELQNKPKIYLTKFDLVFFKSIKDWENIGYYPIKFPEKFYTIMYNEKKAGVVGTIVTKGHTYWEIAIHKSFRGLGILSVAAELITKKENIKRLYSTVWMDNKDSYYSHKKAGFKEISKNEKEKMRKSGELKEGSIKMYKDFKYATI